MYSRSLPLVTVSNQADAAATVSVGTANLMNRGQGNPRWNEGLRDRHDRQVEVLRAEDVDIWALQELCSPTPDGAAQELMRLADACDMDCYVEPPWASEDGGYAGRVALATAATGFHVGLMWRPERIKPVADSWASFGRDRADLWHALASLVLDIDGTELRVASFHADPFDPVRRMQEAQQVLRALYSDDRPGIIAGDWNSMSAARVRLPWSRRWWRPWQATEWYDEDVYRRSPWFPSIVHQLDSTSRRQRADRRAAELLESRRFGRLADCAVLAGAPYTPTTGHHETDPHPPRRPDRILATEHLAERGAVLSYTTVATDAARASSDHLPVITRIRLDDLGQGR